MKKGQSLSLLGGKGHVVQRQEQIPEWLRRELRVRDADYEELQPFVYCEYYTLRSIISSLALGLGLFVGGAILTVLGIIYDLKALLWIAAGLWFLWIGVGLFAGVDILYKIVNSRSGPPARKDHT